MISKTSYSRRTFLKSSALVSGMGLVSTLPIMSGDSFLPRRATRVIYLCMEGGMSHLDTFDTKPGNAKVQGPVESIASNVRGLHLSGYLPKMARQMHHVALLRSMTTVAGAHELAKYTMRTSYPMRGTVIHPHLGSWILNRCGKINPNLPGFVSIGNNNDVLGSGFMEAKYGPILIGDANSGLQNSRIPGNLQVQNAHKRVEMTRWMNKRFYSDHLIEKVKAQHDVYESALKLMNSRDLAAFDITQEPDLILEEYGESHFARGCLLARRLVEHGVRFVEVNFSGWDTHDNNFTRVQKQCLSLDQGLSVLLNDLHRRGLLEETLVVLTTEFGRTPAIDSGKQLGRDHHPKAYCSLLAGGGIRGGQVYGSTDSNGDGVKRDKVRTKDFNATIAWAMGLDTEEIFFSPAKRPFTIANKGKPITKLFG